ncbi:DNA-directed RNA polymerase I subunit RPA49 [Nephila pilipes]|uniref:DNA-directed RNA polymerase I subunit RPA49 n=1 Tax=Nephila pilipes TaxID=299642 RepID=A0A8X6ULP5_NEPPI|nr:DNA-directed RNA polymerase I subunit RPA49 [Nephila pilipes]
MDKSELKFSPSIISDGAEFPVHLVEFSHANVKFQKEIFLKFQSYKCSELNGLARPKKMVVASSQNLHYAGSNYESTVSKISSSLLKVGIYNKNTHKFKLYDADFFHLKPLLKSNFDRIAMEKSWSEKNEDLVSTFGTKNRKRMINSRLQNELTSSVSLQSLSSRISGNSLKIEESKQELEIIPPQNKEAKCVDEIYNLFDIISKEEYGSLDSEANIFINIPWENLQLWKSEAKFCNFIIHYLEVKLGSISPHIAKLLYYLHYMIIMIKSTYRDLKKKDPFPGIPQPYKKSLTEKYLVNRAMPQRLRDKLLAHAMVLALILNNYHIDGKIWASSTHVSMSRIVLVAYSLGCHVHNQKKEDTKSIELKLPLYRYEPKGKKKK